MSTDKPFAPSAAIASHPARAAGSSRSAIARGPVLLLGLGVAALLGGCVNVDESVSPRPSEQWRPPSQATGKGGKGSDGRNWATVATPFDSATATIGLHPLDLSALVDIALENNPQTRISWFRAKASAAALGQADSAYYPTANLGADVTFLHSRNATIPGTNNTTRYGPSLNINWLLFNFGGREAQVDSARESLYAANYNFNQAFQQVVRDVTVAYYNFYAAQAQVEATQAFLKNAEATADAANKKLKEGLGNRQDSLRAIAEVSSAQAQLQANYAQIEAARANLADTLGVVVSASLQVVTPENFDKARTDLLDQDVNKLIAEAMERKPALLAAQSLVRASEADVRAARAALWPEISVGGSGSYYRYTGGSYVDNPQEQYGIGVILNWNIFDGFNRRYAITRAEEELRAQRETLRQAELQVVSDIWTAYYAYRSSLRQVEATESAVTAQEQAYEAIKTGYASGINSLLDLLTSQQNLDTAREQNIDARANVGTSLANLALAIGSLN